ncbi:MAG: PspC domain-containing protein, partial [Alistipes sp.]|nr:PspC domain-containing protein [Alistipes sp.]
MNKVKKCSIAGVSFTLETDAYETLNAYIDSLRNAYKGNPDGEEIIADIEVRIAELILSTLPADSVVAKPLIDNIIRQLGSADEIEEEQPETNSHNADKVDQNGNPRIPRRLYRDLSNGKLGGVCAGLANYFDVDTVWIRLAMFLPL